MAVLSEVAVTDRDPEILGKLDQVLAAFASLDARLRSVETGQARLEGHVDGINGRLAEMSARISDIYTRLPVPIAYQPPTDGKRRA